ncbi:MAG: cobyrinate a,c-diamide synthase [Nitrospiraceae bacterium]|nr:cobyrinate a,c-diamide synthase [Nitrospiraceae bacterium]
MRGMVIAGTNSGCGKTTITLGIMAALRKMGLDVQPFKAGPDFIDAGLHRLVTNRLSRNLDIWMCGSDYVKNSYSKYSGSADISVVEGVMGMFDGDNSTAHLASMLNLPVLLVVNAYGMAESAGAMVSGFVAAASDAGADIAGVIFNNVGSERHYDRVRRSIKDTEALGFLPADIDFKIPSRHLGLAVAEENPIAGHLIERLADAVHKSINIEKILGIAGTVSLPLHSQQAAITTPECGAAKKIAVAYDRAFCFYYEDNLDLLKDAGAEIVKFSLLEDERLPDNAAALYIGGGYPELYADALSRNISMLKSVKGFAESGMPVYAECGGMMYLSQRIHDFEGKAFNMSGVMPFDTVMKKGRPALGYREIALNDDCAVGRKGEVFRGHEFHYSVIKDDTASENIYTAKNSSADLVDAAGFRYKNTLASYVHLHFGSNSCTAKNFLEFIKEK